MGGTVHTVKYTNMHVCISLSCVKRSFVGIRLNVEMKIINTINKYITILCVEY